ncbi:MAG: hypothetical protein LCI00_05865 [Chloroflexi bacterium]|nr:hypothetical protein [Chloroflexota bacterium]MCC6891882.1 hypothetical protein [Anaerolineae bacterium]
MLPDASKSPRIQWWVLLPLAGILLGVYAFTYSGRIESGDTLSLFNATASMVDYGDLLLDKSAADTPPTGDTPPSAYPLASVEVEPMHLILSTPLYWLASHLPNIGLVHAVWFFNIFVAVVCAAVLYIYASTLGYRPLVAVVAALALGLGTLLWPYSRTFFREPLAGLFILLTALCIERWRLSRYRSFVFLILSILTLAAAFLSKEAVIFALPAFILILAPAFRLPKWCIRLAFLLTVLVFAVLILSALAANLTDITPVYELVALLIRRSPQQVATMHRALHSYLLSIGGSVWATSPVLLLVVPGMWALYRSGKYRYPFALISVVLAFAFGYAFLRGDHWFGGLSWPPRFLIPAVPILMLGTLPAWDRVLKKPLHFGWVMGTVIVAAYSLWVQFSAVSYTWGTYINLLPPEANQLLEWGGGLNAVPYLRWVMLPKLWGGEPFDFAWVRASVDAWPLVCILVVVVSAFWLVRLLRRQGAFLATRSRFMRGGAAVLYPLGLLLLIGLGLSAINHDVVYAGSNTALRSILPLLASQTAKGDVLLLSNNEYESFFLNHGKLPLPRVISLPDAPGERPNEGQELVVTSTNPDALLVKSSVPLMHSLAKYRPTLWLLSDFGIWQPWAIRPAERFMVSHYYPIREFTSDPLDTRIRLIEYSTVPAPDPFAFRGPDHLADLGFGDSIRLLGFTLPLGETYHAGDILPISLYWRSDTQLDTDYTVAYFVADSLDSVVAQGEDAQPAWGFAPTSGWQAGVPQWDNRALRLPSTLPTGQYQIWLRLYQSNDSTVQLPVSGETAVDNTLAVLPITIQIAG